MIAFLVSPRNERMPSRRLASSACSVPTNKA